MWAQYRYKSRRGMDIQMKKTVCIFFSVLILLGTMACTQADTQKNSKKSMITIEFRDLSPSKDGPIMRWLQKAKDTWNNKEFEVKLVPLFESTHATRVSYYWAHMLQTDQAPDLILADFLPDFANYIMAGDIADLSKYVADYPDWADGSYYQTLQDSVHIDEAIYGVPCITDVKGLWYNKSIMRQAGLSENFEPKNWEEFFGALETIKENCPGVTPFWSHGLQRMQRTTMLMTASGGGLIDAEDGSWIKTSPFHLKLLEFFERLYKKELVLPTNERADMLTTDFTAMKKSFRDGKTAICLYDQTLELAYGVDSACPWGNFYEEVQFSPFPTDGVEGNPYTTDCATQYFAITEKSTHKQAAFDFITHCMDPKSYNDVVVEMNAISVRRDTAETEKYRSRPFKEAQTDLIDYAKIRLIDSSYMTNYANLMNVIASVEEGTLTAEEALEKCKF